VRPLFDTEKQSKESLKALGKLYVTRFGQGPGRPASLLNDLLAERTSEALGKVNRANLSKKQRRSMSADPMKSGRPPKPDAENRRIVELVRWLHDAEGLSLTYNSIETGTAFIAAQERLKYEGIKLSASAIRGRWQKNKERFPGK
jgi:hypothetical protein